MPTLLFFSDFICPWCYIAERGALAPLRERYALDFSWRGFELHPGIPKGGMDVAAMLGKDRMAAAHARLLEVARSFGVDFEPRDHAPSTKPALAIAEHARDKGRLDAWRAATMDAHWRDHRDIEDRGVLAELASEAGLDPAEALAFLDRPDIPDLLAAQRAEAARWGVNGIPTWFVLPDGWQPGDARPPEGQPQPVRVVGCQPMDVVERAARVAGAQPRA